MPSNRRPNPPVAPSTPPPTPVNVRYSGQFIVWHDPNTLNEAPSNHYFNNIEEAQEMVRKFPDNKFFIFPAQT